MPGRTEHIPLTAETPAMIKHTNDPDPWTPSIRKLDHCTVAVEPEFGKLFQSWYGLNDTR